MAEHGLVEPVIGVAFDGTGYGTDGTIWGGEILICEGAGFERYSHLRTIEMIGGDASMRDGWKSAVSKLYDCGESETGQMNCPLSSGGSPSRSFDIDITDIVEYSLKHDTLSGYAGERAAIASAIAQGVNTVTTSSMGRLFDAVASLLGIHHVNRYEGECAIMLENAAWRALQGIDTNEVNVLALRFHHTVANMIREQCRAVRNERGITEVCLSGGVFQNKLLMEETLRLLRKDGFRPYYNKTAPPNDGNISLGQAYIAMQTIETSTRLR
jgi:hydrogenase maturation protein HypF